MNSATAPAPSRPEKLVFDVMDEDDFAKFLRALSPDDTEAGRLYIALQESLIRFFNVRGLSDGEGAANETLERAANKIAGGAVVPNVKSFCLGIARNVFKEWLRKEGRDRNSFVQFIEDLDNRSNEEIEEIYRFLKPCFDELDPEDGDLLIKYCQIPHGRARSEHRRKLAAKLGTTVLGLRMQVTRLRAGLRACVKRRKPKP